MQQYKKILTGKNTFYVDWFNSIKKINKENIIICDFKDTNTIKNIINNIDYILPLSEKDYNIIINIIDNIRVLYPNKDTINLLHNKMTFTHFMLENFNEYIPDVYYLDNEQLKNIEYPVIYKPIYSTNGAHMKIIYNDTELSRYKTKFIIQKFIEDEYEYSAYILCIDGKIINYKIIRCKYKK